MREKNKRPRYLGILVFLLLAANALGQGKLWQAIQLDSSTDTAFRKRIETVPASTAPPRSPIPGFFSVPGVQKRYLYDVVMIENGVETVLETIEIRRFEGMESGVNVSFALLAACFPVPGQVVYVSITQGKMSVNTATRGSDGSFRKVKGELVAHGLAWTKARLEKENDVLRLFVEGDDLVFRVFERQESGSFVFKSEVTRKPQNVGKGR